MTTKGAGPQTFGTRPSRAVEPLEIAFGAALLVLGTFIIIAVSNPLEIAVYAGGPIMAVAGLAMVIVAIVRQSGRGPVMVGTAAFVLGALLAIHDFLFPPGIAVFIHLGIGVGTLVLGMLQLARRRRYYARWFKRAAPLLGGSED